MNKYATLLASAILALTLAGCGENAANEELDANTDKATAKTGEEATPSPNESAEETEEEPADIWTYYDNATYEDDFAGLVTKIEKVVVSDIAPTYEDETAETSAVGVKFTIENTTSDAVFSTYPDQAVLITSTGEQIDMPDMLVSDHIGGDIHEGVIKEGSVIWYLERGEAEAIEWIKLEWTSENTSDENFNTAYHTHTVTLDLK